MKIAAALQVRFEAFREGSEPNASGTITSSAAFDEAVASMRAKLASRLEVSTVVRDTKLSGPVLREVIVEGNVGQRRAMAIVDFDADTDPSLCPKPNRKLVSRAVRHQNHDTASVET